MRERLIILVVVALQVAVLATIVLHVAGALGCEGAQCVDR